MPLTTPDNIFYADGSTPLSVEAISAAEATSIQDALTNSRAIRSYRWADLAARNAQIDMQAGDEGYQIDTNANYRYNGTDWRRSEGGLVLIKPSSVAGTGVTMSSSGKITFTAGTAINVNGCFTTDFDNYRVMLNIPTTSAVANFSVRMRAAGVDSLATVYSMQRFVSSSTTTSSSQLVNQNVWPDFGVGNRERQAAIMDLFSPQLPEFTLISAKVMSMSSNRGFMEQAGSFEATTQFDGFSVLNSGGTLTGTMMIYGYNQ